MALHRNSKPENQYVPTEWSMPCMPDHASVHTVTGTICKVVLQSHLFIELFVCDAVYQIDIETYTWSLVNTEGEAPVTFI
jgi:hypothetical protein